MDLLVNSVFLTNSLGRCLVTKVWDLLPFSQNMLISLILTPKTYYYLSLSFTRTRAHTHKYEPKALWWSECRMSPTECPVSDNDTISGGSGNFKLRG